MKSKKKETSFDLRERIGVECDLADISRAELARRIGKTAQSLNSTLSTGDMRASILKKISEVLGVSMERLMSPVTDEEYVKVRKLKQKNKN